MNGKPFVSAGVATQGSNSVNVPEVLFLQPVNCTVMGCAGSETENVVSIYSNAPQNLTVTRTFFANTPPAQTSTFEIAPPGLITPLTLKITLPLRQSLPVCTSMLPPQAQTTA
jgi:hypothetical protein